MKNIKPFSTFLSIQIAIAASRLAEVLDDVTKYFASHWIDYRTRDGLGVKC